MMDEESERLELEHFCHVARCLLFYREHALSRVMRARNSFRALSPQQQEFAQGFIPKLRQLSQNAIVANHNLILAISESVHAFVPEGFQASDSARPTEFDMDKVYTTIKQFYRDWSKEGAQERAGSYGRLISKVLELYPDQDKRGDIRILVPGSGLGRLAWEFAHEGFQSQGNEWSAYMLFAANCVLNRMGGAKEHTAVYPFAHMFSNQRSLSDQLACVHIPDVDTSVLPASGSFSMAAGDFLEAYQEAESWDCVASCFFLDTAKNILDFLQRIWTILRPGGYLINIGPLLYHFENHADEMSIELTHEELMQAMAAIGFELLEHDEDVPLTYIANPRSMLKSEYRCIYFLARKPEKT